VRCQIASSRSCSAIRVNASTALNGSSSRTTPGSTARQAVDLDAAGVGALQPRDQAEQGRLAAPARADQADDLRSADLEVEVAQHGLAAEPTVVIGDPAPTTIPVHAGLA
jgi:hypothetical protein